MCGGSILSCCPRNPHGHERALKEEEEEENLNTQDFANSDVAPRGEGTNEGIHFWIEDFGTHQHTLQSFKNTF